MSELGALEDFEEIAEQTSFRISPKTHRTGCCGYPWSISPSLERASPARERKPIAAPEQDKQDKPESITLAPAPASTPLPDVVDYELLIRGAA